MAARFVVITAAFVALSLAVFAQGPRRDGRWEVKMEMEMPGMPSGLPPFTTTQCITPEEANDPQKSMPQMGRGRGRGADPNCKMTDYKTEGNKVTWSMKCAGDTPMTGKGEFAYEADAYTGTVMMEGGRAGAMKLTYSAKRLGDCVK